MSSNETVFNLIDLTNKNNITITNATVNEISHVMQLPDNGLATSESIPVWDEDNAVVNQGDCRKCSILQKKLKISRGWNRFFKEKLINIDKILHIISDYEREKQKNLELQLAYDQRSREWAQQQEQLISLLNEVQPLREQLKQAEKTVSEEVDSRVKHQFREESLIVSNEQLQAKLAHLNSIANPVYVENLNKKLKFSQTESRKFKHELEYRKIEIEELRSSISNRLHHVDNLSKKLHWALNLVQDTYQRHPSTGFEEKDLEMTKLLIDENEQYLESRYDTFKYVESKKYEGLKIKSLGVPSFSSWITKFRISDPNENNGDEEKLIDQETTQEQSIVSDYSDDENMDSINIESEKPLCTDKGDNKAFENSGTRRQDFKKELVRKVEKSVENIVGSTSKAKVVQSNSASKTFTDSKSHNLRRNTRRMSSPGPASADCQPSTSFNEGRKENINESSEAFIDECELPQSTSKVAFASKRHSRRASRFGSKSDSDKCNKNKKEIPSDKEVNKKEIYSPSSSTAIPSRNHLSSESRRNKGIIDDAAVKESCDSSFSLDSSPIASKKNTLESMFDSSNQHLRWVDKIHITPLPLPLQSPTVNAVTKISKELKKKVSSLGGVVTNKLESKAPSIDNNTSSKSNLAKDISKSTVTSPMTTRSRSKRNQLMASSNSLFSSDSELESTKGKLSVEENVPIKGERTPQSINPVNSAKRVDFLTTSEKSLTPVFGLSGSNFSKQMNKSRKSLRKRLRGDSPPLSQDNDSTKLDILLSKSPLTGGAKPCPTNTFTSKYVSKIKSSTGGTVSQGAFDSKTVSIESNVSSSSRFVEQDRKRIDTILEELTIRPMKIYSPYSSTSEDECSSSSSSDLSLCFKRKYSARNKTIKRTMRSSKTKQSFPTRSKTSVNSTSIAKIQPLQQSLCDSDNENITYKRKRKNSAVITSDDEDVVSTPSKLSDKNTLNSNLKPLRCKDKKEFASSRKSPLRKGRSSNLQKISLFGSDSSSCSMSDEEVEENSARKIINNAKLIKDVGSNSCSPSSLQKEGEIGSLAVNADFDLDGTSELKEIEGKIPDNVINAPDSVVDVIPETSNRSIEHNLKDQICLEKTNTNSNIAISGPNEEDVARHTPPHQDQCASICSDEIFMQESDASVNEELVHCRNECISSEQAGGGSSLVVEETNVNKSNAPFPLDEVETNVNKSNAPFPLDEVVVKVENDGDDDALVIQQKREDNSISRNVTSDQSDKPFESLEILKEDIDLIKIDDLVYDSKVNADLSDGSLSSCESLAISYFSDDEAASDVGSSNDVNPSTDVKSDEDVDCNERIPSSSFGENAAGVDEGFNSFGSRLGEVETSTSESIVTPTSTSVKTVYLSSILSHDTSLSSPTVTTSIRHVTPALPPLPRKTLSTQYVAPVFPRCLEPSPPKLPELSAFTEQLITPASAPSSFMPSFYTERKEKDDSDNLTGIFEDIFEPEDIASSQDQVLPTNITDASSGLEKSEVIGDKLPIVPLRRKYIFEGEKVHSLEGSVMNSDHLLDLFQDIIRIPASEKSHFFSTMNEIISYIQSEFEAPNVYSRLQPIVKVVIICILRCSPYEKIEVNSPLPPTLFKLFRIARTLEKRLGLEVFCIESLVSAGAHKILLEQNLRANSLTSLTTWVVSSCTSQCNNLECPVDVDRLHWCRSFLVDLLFHHKGKCHEAILAAVRVSKRAFLRKVPHRSWTVVEHMIRWIVSHGRWDGPKAVTKELEEVFQRKLGLKPSKDEFPRNILGEILDILCFGDSKPSETAVAKSALLLMFRWCSAGHVCDEFFLSFKKVYYEKESSSPKVPLEILRHYFRWVQQRVNWPKKMNENFVKSLEAFPLLIKSSHKGK